ncbi:MAG: hypothetical protein L0Y71_25080 [Gemmataceae bacterium]|nr:hypothetical protein [Gemmataceae bacterium]
MEPRTTKAADLPGELAELRRCVEALPRTRRRRLAALCDGLTAWAERQQRLVQAAQELVEQLQLDIKYLEFDLEATRRERDALRS